MKAIITNENEKVKVKIGRIITDIDKKIVNIQLSQKVPISYKLNDSQLNNFIIFLMSLEENNSNIKFCDFNILEKLSEIKKPNRIIADIKTLNKRWIFLFIICGGDITIEIVKMIISYF